MNEENTETYSHDHQSNISITCCICGEDHFYKQCDFVKVSCLIPNKEILSRARASLPDVLMIKQFADSTSSVYAKECIGIGTEFGPFEAQKLFFLNPEITFPLKVFSSDELELSEYFLDTTDENNCCWMIFIKPASNFEEQNLICYQNGSDLFYAAIKNINPGEPLLVWYAPCYAVKMNKDVLQANNNEIAEEQDLDVVLEELVRKQQQIVARDTWNCKFCYKLEKNVIHFSNHLIQHYQATLRKRCELCNASFLYRKDLKKHFKVVHSNHVLSQTLHSKLQPETDNNKTIVKNTTIHIEEPKETSMGGPLLLNNLLIDSLDNSNLLMQQGESTNSMDVCSIEHQNSLLGDNLNLSTDCVIHQNVKDFDHFNFELNETKQEDFTCDLCLKQCLTLKAIVQHLELHTGKYYCKMCNKIFGRKESLTHHFCNRTFNFKCDECNRVFHSRKYLTRHISTMHSKKYTCLSCNKYFHSGADLTNHPCGAIPTEKQKKYKCNACDRVFSTQKNLSRHEQTVHKGKKSLLDSTQYVCPVCTKVIKGQPNCLRHMRTHEEGEYDCDICDKKFNRSDILKEHKKAIHFNEGSEMFQCDQCLREFKTKSLLRSHAQSHKNIDKHQCSKCSACFKHPIYLRRHIKVIHSENNATKLLNLFDCPCCHKRLKLKTSLSRHLRTKHPVEYKNIELSKKEAKKVQFEIEDSNKSCDTDQKCRDLKETIENMDFMTDVNSCNENNGTETIDEFLKENIEIVENLLCGSVPNIEAISQTNRGEDSRPTFNAAEVCLSMPDLTDIDQEITLGEKAYIMENGTIVEPSVENPSNVVLYMLNQSETKQ